MKVYLVVNMGELLLHVLPSSGYKWRNRRTKVYHLAMAGQAASGRRTNVRYILSECLELVHGEGIVKLRCYF